MVNRLCVYSTSYWFGNEFLAVACWNTLCTRQNCWFYKKKYYYIDCNKFSKFFCILIIKWVRKKILPLFTNMVVNIRGGKIETQNDHIKISHFQNSRKTFQVYLPNDYYYTIKSVITKFSRSNCKLKHSFPFRTNLHN